MNDADRVAAAARALAGLGFAVFPLAARSKVPHAGSRGFKDATSDPDAVTATWQERPGSNVGIACGALSGGLLVVDIPAGEGLDHWRRLLRRCAPTHAFTLTQLTGTGGLHYLYRVDGPARTTAGMLGGGIDTRGDGGYIVAPPSVHPNGTRYRWGPKRTIAPAPGWLLELLSHAPEPPPRAALPTSDGQGSLEGLLQTVARAPEGRRNELLNWAAYRAGFLVAQGVVDAAHVEYQLAAAALAAGLDRRETVATIRSGLRAGELHAPDAPLPEVPLVAPSVLVPYVPVPRVFVPRQRPPRAA